MKPEATDVTPGVTPLRRRKWPPSEAGSVSPLISERARRGRDGIHPSTATRLPFTRPSWSRFRRYAAPGERVAPVSERVPGRVCVVPSTYTRAAHSGPPREFAIHGEQSRHSPAPGLVLGSDGGRRMDHDTRVSRRVSRLR